MGTISKEIENVFKDVKNVCLEKNITIEEFIELYKDYDNKQER